MSEDPNSQNMNIVEHGAPQEDLLLPVKMEKRPKTSKTRLVLVKKLQSKKWVAEPV